MALDVYLTNACDLRCKFCFKFDSEEAPSIDFDEVRDILTHAYQRGHRYVSITGGEPFIYKRIFEVIQHAHEMGYWITILSHGGLLNSEKVDRLREYWRLRVRISLDGPNAATHDDLRGKGTFSKTMEGIELLISRGISVGFGVTVSELNVHYMEDIVRLALDKGVTFIRFTPIVRVKRGKQANVTSKLHEQVLRNILNTTLKYRHLVDLPADMPESINLPIDTLSTKRCMAGKWFYGITPDKRLVPCPLIDESPDVPEVRYEGNESFDEATRQMEKLFANITDRLQGICSKCAFRDICCGGCLAEKLSFDRSLYAEQPVCIKLILDKLLAEYDRKDINGVVNSWLYSHRNSLEFSQNDGCMRHAPIWSINFKPIGLRDSSGVKTSVEPGGAF